MKNRVFNLLIIISFIVLFFSCIRKEIIKTVKPEFFIEGIADAIHSIAFDSKGFMYVGSLGSNETSPVRKYGIKEIFRIDPEGNVEVFDTVECQYIPYMTIDSEDNLYITLRTAGMFQIMKMNTISKEKYIYPFKEFERLRIHFDNSNNIYFSKGNGLYKFNKDGTLILHTEISGLFEAGGKIYESLTFNDDLTYVYTHRYMENYVKKRCLLGNGKTSEPEIVIDNLIGVKFVLLDNERNYLYILQYDTQDRIILLKPDGKIVKYNLDLSHFPQHESKFYHLNDMNFDSSYFGKDYLYLVTWDGDILKVKLEDEK